MSSVAKMFAQYEKEAKRHDRAIRSEQRAYYRQLKREAKVQRASEKREFLQLCKMARDMFVAAERKLVKRVRIPLVDSYRSVTPPRFIEVENNLYQRTFAAETKITPEIRDFATKIYHKGRMMVATIRQVSMYFQNKRRDASKILDWAIKERLGGHDEYYLMICDERAQQISNQKVFYDTLTMSRRGCSYNSRLSERCRAFFEDAEDMAQYVSGILNVPDYDELLKSKVKSALLRVITLACQPVAV